MGKIHCRSEQNVDQGPKRRALYDLIALLAANIAARCKRRTAGSRNHIKRVEVRDQKRRKFPVQPISVRRRNANRGD
jgi:hypothetical protein